MRSEFRSPQQSIRRSLNMRVFIFSVLLLALVTPIRPDPVIAFVASSVASALIGKGVNSFLDELWPDPYKKHMTETVDKINEGIDSLHGTLNTLGHNMDENFLEIHGHFTTLQETIQNNSFRVIEAVTENAMENHRLELQFRELAGYVRFIDAKERAMRQKILSHSGLHEKTKTDFWNSITSPVGHSVALTLEQIHILIVGTNGFQPLWQRSFVRYFAQYLKDHPEYAKKLKQSPRDLLVSLYLAVIATEVKGSMMLKFAYEFHEQLLGNETFALEKEIVRKELFGRINATRYIFQEVLQPYDSIVTHLRPPSNNIRPKSSALVRYVRNRVPTIIGYGESRVYNLDETCPELRTNNRALFGISLKEHLSDIHENKVITGLRFGMRETFINFTRLEVQEGVLGDGGRANQSEWVDYGVDAHECSDVYQVEPRTNPKIYVHLSRFRPDFVLTGVRFRNIAGVLVLEGRQSRIDARGRILVGSEEWVSDYEVKERVRYSGRWVNDAQPILNQNTLVEIDPMLLIGIIMRVDLRDVTADNLALTGLGLYLRDGDNAFVPKVSTFDESFL